MKKQFLCFLTICTIFLTGCYDYNDINTVILATSCIVDLDEENNYVIYVEAFHAYRNKENNAEKGQRLILVSTGKTLFEAIRIINKSTNFKVNYSHNKVILFTGKAARYGLGDFIDIFLRSEEFVLRSYVCIYEGDVSDLLNMDLKQEEYIGLYFKDLMNNEVVESFFQTTKLYEFYNDRAANDGTQVITLLNIDKRLLEEKVGFHKAAVLQKDKMVDVLEKHELDAYNYIMGGLHSGVLPIPHPTDKNKYVTLEILKHNLKTEIKYDGEKIKLHKTLKLRCSFVETQQHINLNNSEVLDKLDQEIKAHVKVESEKLFEKYKKKNIDIFHVTEEMKRHYPNDKVANPLEITELHMEVMPNIIGSPNIQSFQ